MYQRLPEKITGREKKSEARRKGEMNSKVEARRGEERSK